VEIPQRKTLPHNIPSWIDPQKEIYFVSINCAERFRNQLALPEISERLFETVRYREELLLWWPHLFLLMPDHLHALLSFPPSARAPKLIVRNWKEWTAKELGINWQGDFFEHRLRHYESRREKADYILRNPVRKKLVARPEDWSFVYFGGGEPPRFAT
jgi:putative transposase